MIHRSAPVEYPLVLPEMVKLLVMLGLSLRTYEIFHFDPIPLCSIPVTVYPGGGITPGGRDCLSALYVAPAIRISFSDMSYSLPDKSKH